MPVSGEPTVNLAVITLTLPVSAGGSRANEPGKHCAQAAGIGVIEQRGCEVIAG